MTRYISVFIFCAIILFPSFSMGNREKAKTPKHVSLKVHFGSDKNDIGEDIAYYNDGIYIAGVTLGELPGCRTSGKWDIFLIRYNTAGQIIWCRQWGTPGRDEASGIAVDSSGVYVTGYAEGALGEQNYEGGFDIFISKFDFDGNEIWTREWGTEEAEKGKDILIASSNIYVTGFTEGSLDGNRSAGKSDLFLTKFNRNGEKIFTVQKGSDKPDWGKALAADNEGVYVTGFSQGTFAGDTAFGSDDIILVKYDFDGKEQWSRQWGTEGNDEGNGVVSVTGSVFVAGRTGGSLDGNKHFKYDDAFLSKYTTDGNKKWTVILGTNANDTATGIAAGNSRIYVAGDTSGKLEKKRKPGYSDIYLAEYDNEGKKLRVRQYGTGGFDFSTKLCTSPTGLYMTGDSSFTVKGVQNPGGNRDLFLVKWTTTK